MNFDQQNIIAMLGIEALPDERKIKILDQMTNLLEKRLMARMISQLSADDQGKFADILEKNSDLEVQQFVSEHFPKFPQWIEEEVGKLKQELSDHLKTIG